ncbi:hypothetical protein LJC31_06025 [Synergistaceae bacterium OttesenSCG-928-I11]|nr:hypothetical protein [Synergistaceae bacterium OttesenSCG-928-I11]
MKIAIAATGDGLDSKVAEKLCDAKALHIIDVDRFEIVRVYCSEDENCDHFFSHKVLDENCEAIICGGIRKEPFEVLAGDSVTRYDGSGLTLNEAVRGMCANELPLIRDCEDGLGCPGLHASHTHCHDHP